MKKKFAIVLLLILAVTAVVGSGVPAAFAATTLGTLYDKTYVLDDLQGATIAGEIFDISNYPYTNLVETQVLTFSEYAYNLDESKQSDYGLYVYVYNPSGKAIAETRNAISIATVYDGNMAIDYEKFDLQLLSVSEKEYANLFYKFKVLETEKVLARVNATNTKRRYDIAEIELNYGGAVSAIDVGNKWVYSGFAEGCGATKENTLTCTTDKIDTLKLEVHDAWWRIDNGIDVSDTLNSVYFGVPNSIFEKYGKLQQIKANWFETKTSPIPVLTSQKHYNAILPYVGKSVPKSDIHWYYSENLDSEDNSHRYFEYLSDCKERGSFTDLPYYFDVRYSVYENAGFTFRDVGLMSFNTGVQYPYKSDAEINTLILIDKTLPWLFYSKNKKVSSQEVKDWITDYTKNVGGEFLIDKYSACLFEPKVDKGRQYGWQGADGKGIVIDADALFTIDGFNMWGSLQNFLMSLFVDYDKESVKNIAPIYIVKDDDILNSDNEDIARTLLIDESEVPDFIKQYNANKVAGKQTVLFRFACTKYEAHTSHVQNRQRSDDHSEMIAVQQTVFLDFDVIWLKFVDEEKETVVPTVAAPIDVVGGLTPPAEHKINWLIIGLIIAVIVLLLYILVPPFRHGINALFKGLWWLVTSPFRLIAWIIRKRKKTPQTSAGGAKSKRSKRK